MKLGVSPLADFFDQRNRRRLKEAVKNLGVEVPSEAAGATTVSLTHDSLRDWESVISHEEGWTKRFDSLVLS